MTLTSKNREYQQVKKGQVKRKGLNRSNIRDLRHLNSQK